MFNRRQFISTMTATALLTPAMLRAQTKGITFLGWSQDEAASKPTLATMFNQFRSANPDAPLTTVGFPYAQVQQNVLLRLRSQQPLDVVQLTERWLPQFGATGKMVDLNEVFGKAELEKAIAPQILALGEYKGKQLGLPWTAGSIGMVANANVLRKAGIYGPPATVDEFLSALKAVKKASPQSVPYAMCTKNNGSIVPDFQVWLWTFGGRLFDDAGKVAVNSPAGARALGFMADLVKDGLAAKDIDRPDGRRLFGQNECAFYQDAPLARGFARSNSGEGVKFDPVVQAMATPVLKKGDVPRSFAWAHLLSSFSEGKGHLDAKSPAARLMDYLALQDASQLLYFKEIGLFPVTKSAIASLSGDPYVSSWTRNARSATRDEVSFWPNSAELTTIIGEEVQAAVLGLKTAQAAVASMGQRLEAKVAGQSRS